MICRLRMCNLRQFACSRRGHGLESRDDFNECRYNVINSWRSSTVQTVFDFEV
jgi:hypothetical protein